MPNPNSTSGATSEPLDRKLSDDELKETGLNTPVLKRQVSCEKNAIWELSEEQSAPDNFLDSLDADELDDLDNLITSMR